MVPGTLPEVYLELAPEEIEEVLHEKSVTSGEGWERLYEETSARLKYIVDGKEYNDAEIAKLTLDKDAKTRAIAFISSRPNG